MPQKGIFRHTPTLAGEQKIRALSIDSALMPHVSDAISTLTEDNTWEKVGDDIDDILEAAAIAIDSWYSDMLIGSVSLFIVTPPAGWLLLDGSTYAIVDYPELAALLDDALKSGSNFTLPDTDSAFVYGVDDKAASAAISGSNTLTLTINQLPSHTHTYIPPVLTVEAETPTTPIPTAGIGSQTNTGATGSGDDIDRRPLRFGCIFAVYAGRE